MSWLLVILYVVSILSFATTQESGAGEMTRLLMSWLPNLSGAQIRELVFVLRKTGHVLAYFILTLITFNACRFTKGLKKKPLLWAVLLAGVIAALDEANQLRMAHRTGSSVDVVIDGIGILAAAAGLWVFGLRRKNDSSAETSQENRSEHNVEDQ